MLKSGGRVARAMAVVTAEERRTSAWWRLSWQRVLAAVEGYPLERIGFAALAAGVVLRLCLPFLMDLRSDGDTYAAMGHAWSMHGRFAMPYGDVATWAPGGEGCAGLTAPYTEDWMHACPGVASNHYPPAYPFYLGIVYTIFGYGIWQTKWAAVAIAIAALAVVYACTRDLYGRTAAALVAGLLALEPQLLWVTGAGFSENMVLLFFALTMWAIIRSLKDDRYIILAGLFAGIAYLSRASVGYFFVVAGAGGFLWRFYYRRWKLFTNYWYMLAILVFASIAFLWAWRNVYFFGWETETFTAFGRSITLDIPMWETSSYTRWVQEHALDNLGELRHGLLYKIPLYLAFLAFWIIPLLPETWRSLRRIREEETSALWLSTILVTIIAWFFTAMFWVYENTSLYWLDNHRYFLIALLPLGWLLLREARPERASFRIRYVLLLLALFATCAATILAPVKFADLRAAEYVDPFLVPGDEIAVDGSSIKYAFYAYLSDPTAVQVYGWTDGERPEFVITLDWTKQYGDEYVHIGDFRQKFWNGGTMTAWLYARQDVIDERGLPPKVFVERDWTGVTQSW